MIKEEDPAEIARFNNYMDAIYRRYVFLIGGNIRTTPTVISNHWLKTVDGLYLDIQVYHKNRFFKNK